MRKPSLALIVTLALAGPVLIRSTPSAEQTNGTPERFTAFAVNMGSPGRAAAGTVEIAVDRWSSEAERTRLVDALFEKGPDKLLDTLTDLPRAGFIRTPNSLGYDIHFANRVPLAEGGERIVLATDRYITFWEAANRPRSVDYPFTVIELHIGRDGTGEGKMSIATKITADKKDKTIVLENYTTQPVLLREVKRQAS